MLEPVHLIRASSTKSMRKLRRTKRTLSLPVGSLTFRSKDLRSEPGQAGRGPKHPVRLRRMPGELLPQQLAGNVDVGGFVLGTVSRVVLQIALLTLASCD